MPSNSSGHLPLTHYERTKKFKSSSYGTTTTRLSGDTQTAFGHCSLSLTPVMDETAKKKGEEATVSTLAMVTPSGHLYGKEAIFDYLLTKTAEYKEKLALYERQKQQDSQKADTTESDKRKREEAFEKSHRLPQHDNHKKRIKSGTGKNSDLVRTSYWLADMQPDEVEARHKEPDRPASPYSGDPLRRKDLREVELQRRPKSEDVLCAISGKVIRVQPAVAYFVKDKSRPGVVVLKDVYEMTIDTSKKKDSKKGEKLICPLTGQKIKHTIELKTGGSGFASHNSVEVKTYRPTIT